MTDEEIIKVGDICAYFSDNQNKSFSIVEVVKELSEECAVVKFHQVLRDDSGNGYLTYLCKNDKTMNVSKKYLHKLDLINRQKAEIERLQNEIGSLNKNYPCTVKMNDYCLVYARSLDDYDNLIGDISAEGIKECVEKIKDLFSPEDDVIGEIENIKKEMTDFKE